MQMSQDAVNHNRMAKEIVPFASVKKKLLPLLMTGKERTADEKRRGVTRESESVRLNRKISRIDWAWRRVIEDERNGVSIFDEDLVELDRKFAKMKKRQDAQHAGGYGEARKWWLAEKEKERDKSVMLKKHNIADNLLCSESDSWCNDDMHSSRSDQSLKKLSSDDSDNSINDKVNSPPFNESSEELSTDNECEVIRVIPMHSTGEDIVQKDINNNLSEILNEHPGDNNDNSNSIVSGNISNSVSHPDENVADSNSIVICNVLTSDQVISYPTFYSVIMARQNLHDTDHQKLMLSLDWMTESLRTEVKNHSPTHDDMIIDQAAGEYSYKRESFEKACETVFPKGREFFNWLQFRQFGLLFLTKWNISGKHESGYMVCSFTKSKPKKSKGTPQRQKSTITMMKDSIDCQFIIRYTRMGYKKPYLTIIYYPIHITSTNFKHHHPDVRPTHFIERTHLSSRCMISP